LGISVGVLRDAVEHGGWEGEGGGGRGSKTYDDDDNKDDDVAHRRKREEVGGCGVDGSDSEVVGDGGGGGGGGGVVSLHTSSSVSSPSFPNVPPSASWSKSLSTLLSHFSSTVLLTSSRTHSVLHLHRSAVAEARGRYGGELRELGRRRGEWGERGERGRREAEERTARCYRQLVGIVEKARKEEEEKKAVASSSSLSSSSSSSSVVRTEDNVGVAGGGDGTVVGVESTSDGVDVVVTAGGAVKSVCPEMSRLAGVLAESLSRLRLMEIEREAGWGEAGRRYWDCFGRGGGGVEGE